MYKVMILCGGLLKNVCNTLVCGTLRSTFKADNLDVEPQPMIGENRQLVTNEPVELEK